MSTDAELLRRYVRTRDEAAFAELVGRHLNLVYAAALRRTNGRTHLAEEIAQKVFTDLARKAASLQHHSALTGWLHRSTRYAAIDVARGELSRQRLNQSFTIMTGDLTSAKPEGDWESLRPVIDEAMDDLKEVDREIILLRYFDGLGFAAVGERMSLTENAARMRTERALERLRVLLGKRGLTSTATALGLSLANQALATAPAGLAATVSRTAMTVAPAGVLVSLLNTLALNKAATAGIGVGIAAALAGLGWWAWNAPTSHRESALLKTEDARPALAAAPAVATAAPMARPVEDRPAAKPAALLERHSDHGQATPEDTLLTYAWACDTGNAAAMGRLITFSETGRAALEKIYAEMPESVRARFRTPPELLIHSLLVLTMLKPPTGVEQIKKYVTTEIGPDRVMIRKAGNTRGGFTLVRTTEGWRIEMPDRLGSSAGLLKLLNNELVVELGMGESSISEGTVPSAEQGSWPVRRYINAGQATPVAALQTMAWACDQGDVEAMAHLFVIDEECRSKVNAIYAAQPAERRAEWSSVEAFAAAIIVHDGIEQPYPGTDVLALAKTEPLSEGRVTLQLRGATVSGVVFQQTAEGWKYVVREAVVNDYIAQHLTAKPTN